MALLIEIYDVSGAIALAENYHLSYLEALINQTKEYRKSEEEKDQEQIQEIAEQYQDRSFEITTESGKKKKFNIKSFLPVDTD